MLGRVADQLYWMARYSERTENMARIIDVADRMTLTPQTDETRLSAWVSALEVAGAQSGYGEKHGDINGPDVVHYLALDPENPREHLFFHPGNAGKRPRASRLHHDRDVREHQRDVA